MMRLSFFRSFFSTHHSSAGFSLIELVIGSALFAVIALGIYQSYATLSSLVSASRVKITATDLVNERLELIRNMPYSEVGVAGGIPNGPLLRSESFARDNAVFFATTTIRNIDDPFDGTIGGSPNDLSPADYKMVHIDIGCPSCKNFQEMSVTTRVSPKGLETSSENGALFVKVFDANGNPIPQATVVIENPDASPEISITEETDQNGMLQIVDAPPGVNAYHITVSKSGFTSDRTYAPGDADNPNPDKPHATVLLQQVTQVSFAIDKVSTMRLSAVSTSCESISGPSVTVTGARKVGTLPDVLAYDETHTLGSGTKLLSSLAWDTYTFSLSGSGYRLAGVNPPMPVTLLPDAEQDVALVVTDAPPAILLVSVKDGSTGLPLSGASVEISRGAFEETKVTGRGFLQQTDWSGGGGQATVGDDTAYLSSDGNIAVNAPAGTLTLQSIFGTYASNGILTSSTFDTGTTSNFNHVVWSPTSQPPDTGNPNVRLQIASNNDQATWNFFGPDGTAGTFYDTTDTNIPSVHNDTRYFRYRVFLDTASTTFTPTVSDVALTFTSECVPPGQVVFSGLSTSGGDYTVSLEHAGYDDASVSVPISASWQSIEIDLAPQ